MHEEDDPLEPVEAIGRRVERLTGYDLSPEFRALQAHPVFTGVCAESDVTVVCGRYSAELAALMDDFAFNEKAFWRHEPGY